MRIVAFCYKKGVGKDTLGKFLLTDLRCRAPGFRIKHVSFAEKLKDICFQLYGWASLKPGVYYETHRDKKEILLQAVNKTPREIWIAVGNAIRSVHGSTWIDYALKGVDADIIIITDCGFWNEAVAVNEAGGLLCKINRDGLPQGTDPRETELDTWKNWDYIVNNNSTLEYLNQVAVSMADNLLEVRKG